MLEQIKNLFMDDKGGIKMWPIALGIAGAFLLPMIPMIGGLGIVGNLIGAVAGVALGTAASGALGGQPEEAPQAPAGAAQRPQGSGTAMRVEAPRVPNLNSGRQAAVA